MRAYMLPTLERGRFFLVASSLALTVAWATVAQAQIPIPPAQDVDEVWIDPGFKDSEYLAGGDTEEVAVVWFDRQLLDDGASFLPWVQEHGAVGRRELRAQVVGTLKRISEESFAAAEPTLKALEAEGVVRDCRRHWIVNSFTCWIHPENAAVLADVPGAWRVLHGVWRSSPAWGSSPSIGPRFVEAPDEPQPFARNGRSAGWSVEAIGAPRVWDELGITGKGVLTLMSDSGFKLDVGVTAATLYRNPGEIPGNGVDDDKNGYVDDYHGFNFDEDSPSINRGRVNPRNQIHGNMTAALVAGRETSGSGVLVGIAPDSRWAAGVAVNEMESGVEWAIDQGVDIINMSFTLAALNEYRSHWRKVMEHGALAGLFLVSGAGNAGDPNRPNYSPVPMQIQTPEGIPNAVFAVAGVGADGTRPSFSGQGPVLWDTEFFKDGEVAKPDFATYNFQIPATDIDGLPADPKPSGNSMAGPHLTGVLALMLEADPNLTPWAAREILRETSKDILDPGVDSQSGFGLVDAYAAVSEVLRRKHMR